MLRPLHNRIVVQRLEAEERTPGGLYIPEAAKEKPAQGIVIAVGKGRIGEDGTVTPLDVKVGDRVLFAKYSGTESKIEGTSYIVMQEDDVLGVIEVTEDRE